MLGGASSRFRLLLVGSGPDMPRLEAEIEDRGLAGCVHLTGALAHDQVPAMIEATDVVVAPYSADSDVYFSPVKLFEYMAMARPVIAARIGQAADVVEHGRTGWLYTPGNSQELVDLIRPLADNPELCERVGAAARQRILSRYTWQHNARQVIAIAESIIGRRRRTADQQLGVA